MRRNANRIWRRVGRRGCFLLFLAMLDVVYAYSLYSPPATARESSTLAFFSDVAPLWVWALAWFVPGVLCGVQAFIRNDKAAFAAAMGIKVLWGTMYVVGAVAVHLERAYVGAAIWIAFALVVGLISTWPEPAEHVEPVTAGAP